MALNCIACQKELTNAIDDFHRPSPPYKGTVFTSHGNYGSTLFDPMSIDASFLEVNICDDCLRAASREQLVLRGKRPPRVVPDTLYEIWDPDKGKF